MTLQRQGAQQDSRVDDEHDLAALVEQWAKDPEVAKSALRQLLPLVASADESVQSWATEALENCGPPLTSDADWIAEQLQVNNADIVYWSATLLGRIGTSVAEYQNQLAELLDRSDLAGNAKQRVAWALGRLGPLQNPVRHRLEIAANDRTSPRLAAIAALALEGKG